VLGEKPKLRFKLAGLDDGITSVDPDDVDTMLATTSDDRWRAVILLASEAGFRAGEIRGFQRTDLKAGIGTVRRALDKQTNEVTPPKHNKTRAVPFSPRLLEVVDRLPRRGLWLISEPDGSFVSYDRMIEAIGEIYARANVERPPKPLHCLRHTFGTVMAKTTPLPVLRELMGHADIKTTLRYVDVGEDQKRSAIATSFGATATWQRQRERIKRMP
jgi:integrase